MKVTLIGTGSSVPHSGRLGTSVLVEIGEETCLLDCTEGTVRRLLDLNKDYKEIRRIFISHFHIDHTGGLSGFLMALKNDPEISKGKNLDLYGGPGFIQWFDRFLDAFGRGLVEGSAFITCHELVAGDQVENSAFNLKTFAMDHNTESLGFRIQAQDGKILAYTGDTGYCEELISLSTNVDCLIAECSLPNEKEVKGHLTPKLAGQAAHEAGAKALVLVHFYPEVEKIDIAAAVAQEYSGPIFVGIDGMRISV